MNRRGFLRAIAATAVAVPLAPLIPAPKPAQLWSYGWDVAPAAFRPGSVAKLSTVLPVTSELLADAVDLREWVSLRLERNLRDELVYALGEPL